MKNKLKVQGSKLERKVAQMINAHADDYDNGVLGFYQDLQQGGCQSGMVGELIYYVDTIRFYKAHRNDIESLVSELMDEIGATSPTGLFMDKWDREDPFAHEANNQNLLAWFGFEEAARRLMEAQYPGVA